MTIPGKYRPGFAILAVASAALLLIVGSWAFFAAFNQAVLRAALGLVSADGHLQDLLAVGRTALGLVIVAGSLLALALAALWTSRETERVRTDDLIRQLRRFIEGDWRESGHRPSGDELDEVALAADDLARRMRGRPDGNGTGGEVEEIKTRFLEIISHQLRTPLTAVRWNLEALLKGDMGPLTKRQQDMLRITSENYQGILAMLSDWVEALEVERGLLQLNPEPVDLRAFMLGVSDDFKELAKLKRQRFTASLPRSVARVQADKLKLRFVMGKLLSNAMAYTPEGGRVSLRVRSEDGRARIEVEDTGVGIPYEEQPKIFDKFFRASNAAMMQPNASGVGLFVAKLIVGAHGGTIGFRSEEGKGSAFWILLPLLGEGRPKR